MAGVLFCPEISDRTRGNGSRGGLNWTLRKISSPVGLRKLEQAAREVVEGHPWRYLKYL